MLIVPRLEGGGVNIALDGVGEAGGLNGVLGLPALELLLKGLVWSGGEGMVARLLDLETEVDGHLVCACGTGVLVLATKSFGVSELGEGEGGGVKEGKLPFLFIW